MDEFPARIEVIFLGIRIDRLLMLGEQHPAFNFHQGCRHDEEFTGDLNLEVLHRIDRLEVLLSDVCDRNIVDIELILPDQEEEQVEGALKDGQFDARICFGDHGVSRGGQTAACNRKNTVRR